MLKVLARAVLSRFWLFWAPLVQVLAGHYEVLKVLARAALSLFLLPWGFGRPLEIVHFSIKISFINDQMRSFLVEASLKHRHVQAMNYYGRS